MQCPEGATDHRRAVKRSGTPANDATNKINPDGVTDLSVIICHPVGVPFPINSTIRGSVLRTPPPACALTALSGLFHTLNRPASPSCHDDYTLNRPASPSFCRNALRSEADMSYSRRSAKYMLFGDPKPLRRATSSNGRSVNRSKSSASRIW